MKVGESVPAICYEQRNFAKDEQNYVA
jgi:hypothetical protein